MATKLLDSMLTQSSNFDLEDFISDRLVKANALIANTYGESGDAFRNLNDDLQDTYLWTISDLLREANEARAVLSGRAEPAAVSPLIALYPRTRQWGRTTG